MEAKPDEEWRQQSGAAKARGRALAPSQASARLEHSHHIKLLHGGSFFSGRGKKEGERERTKPGISCRLKGLRRFLW